MIGTAGWSIPAALAERFPGPGTHLERYARVMNCVEIDSSFYRPHRTATYERWAASTPPGFRFAVKLPREITHVRRLADSSGAVADFLGQVAGLGDRLGLLLMQLPPSFAFDAARVDKFFEMLRWRHAGPVACEPRERSWFSADADALLERLHVLRVAADPAVVPSAAGPGGWQPRQRGDKAPSGYYRWHGAPRMYWSRYESDWLSERAEELVDLPGAGSCWCIFDNTAAGAALPDALEFEQLVNALDPHR